MLSTASDIQVLTAVYNLLAKLEANMHLAEVAIELSKLTEQIEAYSGVPNSDKQVADIIRDLCKRDSQVNKAIEEELENMSLVVDDEFIQKVFTNTFW